MQVDEIIIRSITLPEKIKIAIEDKLTQEELLKSYEFRWQTAGQKRSTSASKAKDSPSRRGWYLIMAEQIHRDIRELASGMDGIFHVSS